MRGLGRTPKRKAKAKAEPFMKKRSVRVLIQQSGAGFETKVIVPEEFDVPPLVTTDSVRLWRKIRPWLEEHFQPRGWYIDWIYAQFHPEYGSGFPPCPACDGSGTQRGVKLKDAKDCPECHGIKIALPGFNDY